MSLRRIQSLLAAVVLAATGLTNHDAHAEASTQGASQLSSQASPWSNTDFTQARLIAAVTAVGDQSEIPLGLHFKMQKGWKIYWRSPGDAGFPPRLDWSQSKNLAAADMSWPAPERFSILGFDTQGYKTEVVFPIKAKLTKSGEALDIKAKLNYLACKEICIPYQTKLSLLIPPGPIGASPLSHLINRYQAQVPGDGTALGLKVQSAGVTDIETKPKLVIKATANQKFNKPDMFVEGPREIQFGKPQANISEQGNQVTFHFPIFGAKDLPGGPTALFDQLLTVTLVDGNRSAENKLRSEALQFDSPSSIVIDHSIWQIIFFALVGGLILNLMPCVLPVLSIKLLGVVKHGGRETNVVRLSFIASAVGIIFSFALIAAGLLILKTTGMSIGWGIQFQQPWFLITMAIVVTLFACNLWGFFEISLPRWVADAGEHASHVHGLGGHFLTGMLATLLATPCSAPFLGTAVGFALSRGALEIWAIFIALGIGLALPYLVIAIVPSFATRLPRPGRWMVVLRQVLGFALAATAIWLLSVLDALIGRTATALCALFLSAITLILYLRYRREPILKKQAWPAIAVFAVLAFIGPIWFADKSAPSIQASQQDIWKPFDEAAINRFVSQGKIVFVDVTADWCITCQVNKTLVLDTKSIQDQFANHSVIAMKADWTRPNDKI